MPLTILREFLDSHNVRYIVISHSPAFTAQGIAALAHIPGKELAKTVMVKMDHSLIMAVLPASFHVDLSRLKAEAMATTVELASESEFKDRFPDCETGAMPPFGNLSASRSLRMKAWRRIRRLHLTQAPIENWFDWPGRISKSWSNRR